MNVYCFDKTGTLTEEGLDILSVVGANHEGQFMESTSHVATLTPGLMYLFTTCHSLSVVNGRLVGDPIDLKMFEFTDWVWAYCQQVFLFVC